MTFKILGALKSGRSVTSKHSLMYNALSLCFALGRQQWEASLYPFIYDAVNSSFVSQCSVQAIMSGLCSITSVMRSFREVVIDWRF
ncbi:hypothetical protein WA026_012740 [Henosepilachna vigintioctopunctata]|uniref:Uncharacterized protein n=1 Tax=Henosepilachna vigintioctopunctata TaxID=420089 RepID=A0AAW1U6Z6_9CUCU